MSPHWLLFASVLLACNRPSTPSSPVPTSIRCDTRDPGPPPTPAAVVAPSASMQPYLPAGPFSIHEQPSSKILWRLRMDIGESVLAPDGAGGVFVVPDGRFAMHKTSMARVDRTGKIVWSRPSLGAEVIAPFATLGGMVGAVKRAEHQDFDALGFIAPSGQVQYLELGPRVEVSTFAPGENGSFAFAGTVSESHRVGRIVLSEPSAPRHSFVGKLTGQRRPAWVQRVDQAVSSVAVDERGALLYLALDQKSGRRGVYRTDGETQTQLGWLPACVDLRPTILASTGRVYAVGATCGPKGTEGRRVLTGFRFENEHTYRDWSVDSLPADDHLSEDFSEDAWARVELDGMITLVTNRSIYRISPSSAEVTKLVSLTPNQLCPGAPLVSSLAVDADSVFTTTVCVNATRFELEVSTLVLTRYALH